MAELQEDLDPVYLVFDYWDEPRTGVAGFRGVPQWFENIFDEIRDEYSSEYWLTPIGSDAVETATEMAKIFSRWRVAFDSGKTDRSTHPALPDEKDEYYKLKASLEQHLAARQSMRYKVHGEFKLVDSLSSSGRTFQVKWAA